MVSHRYRSSKFASGTDSRSSMTDNRASVTSHTAPTFGLFTIMYFHAEMYDLHRIGLALLGFQGKETETETKTRGHSQGRGVGRPCIYTAQPTVFLSFSLGATTIRSRPLVPHVLYTYYYSENCLYTRSLTHMAPRHPARITPVRSQCGSAFLASCSTAWSRCSSSSSRIRRRVDTSSRSSSPTS
jgi:hypothetical protein